MLMLYSCVAHGASTSSNWGANRSSKRPRRRPALTIDIHCHIHTPECEPLIRDIFSPEKEPFSHFASAETRAINQRLFADLAPKLTSPEERLKDMDHMGIDIQVISPSPMQYYYWTDGKLGLELARLQNNRVAEVVNAHPKRFVGMGTLPLQDIKRAERELERVVTELGFRAIEISSNVNGTDFDDARFQQFFAKVQELGVLLFIHPLGFTDAGRLRDYYLTNIVGQPLDSTLAVSHLIFGGVLEAYPQLKICVAHGGGYLPFYAGRMDHAYAIRAECQHQISRPPSTYLRQLYFDSVVYTSESLAHLVKQLGSERVLLGTDYPFDMGETDPVGHIAGVRSLTRAQKEQIWGGNAAQLLQLGV
jgi:aminocarboxymuconate-semialdehyde decarboxylase